MSPLSLQTPRSLRILLATAALSAALACGAPAPRGEAPTTSPPQAEATPPPYDYPAPVSGHFEDVNVGTFDLVDGIAYARPDGSTAVWLVSEPIASPVLAGGECPVLLARSLALLRDAGWVEVTVDGEGRSDYFASGTPYGGRGKESEVGGGYWQIDLDAPPAARIAGRIDHRYQGRFRFDLPVWPASAGVSREADLLSGGALEPSGPAPTEERLVATYRALRDAARARDLATYLATQGFAPKQVRAIRGLAGIDAELAAHADRFLEPGEPQEPRIEPGYLGVGATGTNSKGEAFFNWYQFGVCGERLVLYGIGLNPQ